MYRFLIVDEDLTKIQVYTEFLRTKGCTTDIASNSADTFLLISEHSYDLILMDIKHPDVNGFDLCSAIRSKTTIPVVFFSQQMDELYQIRGFASGGCDYISKDCSPELLWVRLQARLTPLQSQLEVLREFPPLTMDLQRQRAFINGTNLRLTQIEFALLALLSSRPFTIWAVEDLYEEIWGTSGLPDPQIVQAHLSRMRRKIEKAYPRHDFIETIWRKGYQFVPIVENESHS